jgi:glycosyltransferase involved in cell wall biosynthesis
MIRGNSRGQDGPGAPAPPSEDGIAIGMYHPRAGTRDAGGVSIFVREILSALPSSASAYLYTNDGDGSRGNDGPELITPDAPVDLEEMLLPDLPFDRRLVPLEVAESLRFFAAAVRGGLLDHVGEHVDVLYANGLADAVLLSRALDVPVVRLFHAFDRVGVGGRSMPYLADTAGHVANSDRAAAELSAELGLDVDGVVYPGVDVDRFSPDADAVLTSGDEAAVLFVGRLVEGKGLFDLMAAFREVRDDAHLYLIGRGDETAVQHRAEQLDIADSVTLLGTVEHDNLPGYYAACDVFCLPSHYETFGLVNVEAMACGAPVLTTDIPAIREYVTHGETGYLVDPGDVNALASGLNELLSSPRLRGDLGRSGRETALQYSWESSAERLTEISRGLL